MENRHSQLVVSNAQLSNFRGYIILLVMLLAACAAIFLKPAQRIAEQHRHINLETMIPKQFGDWKENDSLVHLLVSPNRQAVLNKIYSQMLSRTYVNIKGERIMLSVAYGGDQSDNMQVHKPEVCYTAQGFQVQKTITKILDTGFGLIPTKRLLATQGLRVEPITYWITIGDTVVVSGFKQKLAQLKYGLTGKVPDGLLFRISSIGNEPNSYAIQEEFINDLLKALTSESRNHLIGNTALQIIK